MVEVLLDGGAALDGDGKYCPMEAALGSRRFDLVELLVEHGYNPAAVDMDRVLARWDPKIMEYFIERGADVESKMQLATALCARIRTSLGIFRKYRERFPSFQEQAKVALRHHCKEHNMKWVSLLIWAGADPLAPGESEPNVEVDPEEGGLSALGFAALYSNYEVFSLKKVTIRLPTNCSNTAAPARDCQSSRHFSSKASIRTIRKKEVVQQFKGFWRVLNRTAEIVSTVPKRQCAPAMVREPGRG